MKNVDVAIIGAGTAGLSARKEVVKHTSSYVVIDAGTLGTTCARVGCMPSKVFIEVANSFYKRLYLNKMGIKGGTDLTVDYREVMQHVRSLRDRFVSSVMQNMEDWRHSHLIEGKAKFLSPDTLEVNGAKIQAKKIIIATGSRPVMPKSWLHAQELLLTTDDFFDEKDLPKKMAVIGTGIIGIELGQALARLGIETIAIGKGAGLGGLTDPEMIRYASQKISEELPIFSSGVDELTIKNGKLIIHSDGTTFEVDKALVAVGRSPNIDDLGLDAIGVKPDFEPGTFRILGTPIYIAGDVNGERPILHEAADEGKIVGHNAVRDTDQKFSRRTSLAITFTSPNIATVGLRCQELQDKNRDFVVGEVSFEGQGRSIVMNEEKGLLKIFAERKGGLLLGAEIFAPAGEHLAHLLAWAIDARMTVFEALQKPFYHPVVEEGLRTALRKLSMQVEENLDAPALMRCEDPPVGG